MPMQKSVVFKSGCFAGLGLALYYVSDFGLAVRRHLNWKLKGMRILLCVGHACINNSPAAIRVLNGSYGYIRVLMISKAYLVGRALNVLGHLLKVCLRSLANKVKGIAEIDSNFLTPRRVIYHVFADKLK